MLKAISTIRNIKETPERFSFEIWCRSAGDKLLMGNTSYVFDIEPGSLQIATAKISIGTRYRSEYKAFGRLLTAGDDKIGLNLLHPDFKYCTTVSTRKPYGEIIFTLVLVKLKPRVNISWDTVNSAVVPPDFQEVVNEFGIEKKPTRHANQIK